MLGTRGGVAAGGTLLQPSPVRGRMQRGLVVFAIVFLLLPLVAMGAILAVPAASFLLGLIALVLLAIGFTLALGFVPIEG